MNDIEILEVVRTIQSMEERGIFVKDHDIMDAIELVKFNRIVDNRVKMAEIEEEQK